VNTQSLALKEQESITQTLTDVWFPNAAKANGKWCWWEGG